MCSMKALIFHGTMGSPNGNWFPWLQSELISKGWDVDVPAFPTPEGQSLDTVSYTHLTLPTNREV